VKGHPLDDHPAALCSRRLTQWQALTAYFKGLPDADGDGIADLPALFGTLRSRIVTQ